MIGIRDIFDKEILKYTFLPIVMSLLFWGIVLIFFGDNLIELLKNFSQNLPFSDKIISLIENAKVKEELKL